MVRLLARMKCRLSDVLGTGWFAADAANVKHGSTVVVVGDGAVGLLSVLSAKLMGAERIIAMSRHQTRQKLAREFGATDIVEERGGDGVARIKEMTKGVGADSVLECVGSLESMMQAIRNSSGWFDRLRGRSTRRAPRSATGVLYTSPSSRRPSSRSSVYATAH
jgi:threonine dehydrogenase-like Zn-dependent dehydrogenase